jgi:mRNA interferase MazF
MYIKDFNGWNVEKQGLENLGRGSLPFHEKEIWWCSIGINLGHEQDGKNKLYERPVLIIKKFNRKLCWVLPMTSKSKINPYYLPITYQDVVSSVILSQLRLVGVKRLRRYIGKISTIQFQDVKEQLKLLLN